MANDQVLEYLYPEDITGEAISNKVVNEKQTLNPPQEPADFHWVIPAATPYFRDTMKIKHIPTGRYLERSIDWAPGHKFNTASYELQGIHGGVYASILFYDRTLSGEIEFEVYQTLGGNWTLSESKILEMLDARATDPRFVAYEEVNGKPVVFPPVEHNHPADDLTGMRELVVSQYDTAAAIREKTEAILGNLPQLPDNVVDEKIELNNDLLEAKFNTRYTRAQVDLLLKQQKDALNLRIDTIASGGSEALEAYYSKVEADGRFALKTDLDGYITQIQLRQEYYDIDSIDQMFADLQSDLTAVVSDSVNIVLNQYVATVVATTNINQADLQTIDGQAGSATMPVLCVGQTDAKQNGLFVMDMGAWKRIDYPIKPGFTATVTNGALFGGSFWRLVNTSAVTVGTTDLYFVQESKNYPPGFGAHFYGDTAPPGWLAADGSAVSRVKYAALYAAIGVKYGAGNGTTTFNLPDDRGLFTRSLDNGKGIDPSRVAGTVQQGTIMVIDVDSDRSVYTIHGAAGQQGDSVPAGTQLSINGLQVDGSSSTAGAPYLQATRPVNMAKLSCIKY